MTLPNRGSSIPELRQAAGGQLGANEHFALAMLDDSGQLDPGFIGSEAVSNGRGRIVHRILDRSRALAVDIDDEKRIVAVGVAATTGVPSRFAVARYLTTGIPDLHFGGAVISTSPFASQFKAQPPPNGRGFVTLDFNIAGLTNCRATGVIAVLEPDGSIIVVGHGQNAEPPFRQAAVVARLTKFGGLDPSFGLATVVDQDGNPTPPDSNLAAGGTVVETTPQGVPVSYGRGFVVVKHPFENLFVRGVARTDSSLEANAPNNDAQHNFLVSGTAEGWLPAAFVLMFTAHGRYLPAVVPLKSDFEVPDSAGFFNNSKHGAYCVNGVTYFAYESEVPESDGLGWMTYGVPYGDHAGAGRGNGPDGAPTTGFGIFVNPHAAAEAGETGLTQSHGEEAPRLHIAVPGSTTGWMSGLRTPSVAAVAQILGGARCHQRAQ